METVHTCFMGARKTLLRWSNVVSPVLICSEEEHINMCLYSSLLDFNIVSTKKVKEGGMAATDGKIIP